MTNTEQVEAMRAAFAHEVSDDQLARSIEAARGQLAADEPLGKAVLMASAVLAPVPMPLEAKFRNAFMVDVLNALRAAHLVESLRPSSWEPEWDGLYAHNQKGKYKRKV